MSEDDLRHGTTAGHWAHLNDGEKACPPCVAAKTRYEKVRKLYGDLMVPAVGTRRRVQSLMAMGHSGADIARVMGVTYQAVHKIERGTSEKMHAATATRVAAVYEEMCMTIPTGTQRTRTRIRAAGLGYAPPLAWDDIDNPSDRPHGFTRVPKVPAEHLAEDYDFLRREGYTRRLAAERMGVTKKRLEKAIERHSRRVQMAS